MSDKETLVAYRREQSLVTLAEAERMLEGGFSGRSIVNRAYYAMFYMVVALFLKTGVQTTTSKHSGVISVFDREFVLTGKVDRSHSKALHRMFDKRLEFDYKDLVSPSAEEAREAVESARRFIDAIDRLAD